MDKRWDDFVEVAVRNACHGDVTVFPEEPDVCQRADKVRRPDNKADENPAHNDGAVKFPVAFNRHEPNRQLRLRQRANSNAADDARQHDVEQLRTRYREPRPALESVLRNL